MKLQWISVRDNNTEDGARGSVRKSRPSEARAVRVHRGVLQHPTSALDHRVRESRCARASLPGRSREGAMRVIEAITRVDAIKNRSGCPRSDFLHAAATLVSLFFDRARLQRLHVIAQISRSHLTLAWVRWRSPRSSSDFDRSEGRGRRRQTGAARTKRQTTPDRRSRSSVTYGAELRTNEEQNHSDQLSTESDHPHFVPTRPRSLKLK